MCILGEAFTGNNTHFEKSSRGLYFADYSNDAVKQAQQAVRQAKSRFHMKLKKQKVNEYLYSVALYTYIHIYILKVSAFSVK